MKMIIVLATLSACLLGCATPDVSDENIRAVAQELDYGDYSSATLVGKAWKAFKKKDYPEIFGYTNKCVELHGDEGKRMNATLTGFAPSDTAAQLWALNDVGTCLFIMAHAYEELERYPDAVQAYRSLATDYNYAQCWDSKGWFWRPADGAGMKAEK